MLGLIVSSHETVTKFRETFSKVTEHRKSWSTPLFQVLNVTVCPGQVGSSYYKGLLYKYMYLLFDLGFEIITKALVLFPIFLDIFIY